MTSPTSAKAERLGGAPSRAQWAWEWVKTLSVAFVIFLVVRTFLIEAFRIPTGSMEQTLLVGDFLLVNKAVYGATIPGTEVRLPGFRDPERGHIVVFTNPEDGRSNYVKRIVGLPGDTLAMRDGVLYVNGAAQDEPYVQRVDPAGDGYHPRFDWQRAFLAPPTRGQTYRPTRDAWGPIVVPEGHYFVLGDNRDNSLDSRYWGFVPRGLIKGQPLIIYYSFDRIHPFPWIVDARWERVGELVR
jgi:signal peptidase I